MTALGPLGSLPYAALGDGTSLQVEVSGTITPNGTTLTTNAANLVVIVGVIDLIGGLAKRTAAVVSGALTLSGVVALTELAGIVVVDGVLTLTGAATRFGSKALSGAISLIGGFTTSRLRRAIKWIESFGIIRR